MPIKIIRRIDEYLKIKKHYFIKFIKNKFNCGKLFMKYLED